MTLPISLVVILLTGFSTLAVGEETWRSGLYPEDWQPPQEVDFLRDAFLQDWSYAGYHRGERPIPDVPGPLFPVHGADPTGREDATAAIQSALDAAVAAAYGVPTIVLAEAVKAEGSVARVASLYEVDPTVVRDAIHFHEELAAA